MICRCNCCIYALHALHTFCWKIGENLKSVKAFSTSRGGVTLVGLPSSVLASFFRGPASPRPCSAILMYYPQDRMRNRKRDYLPDRDATDATVDSVSTLRLYFVTISRHLIQIRVWDTLDALDSVVITISRT